MTDSQTDLTVSDTLPISVDRTYLQSDTGTRAFGIGANLTYVPVLAERVGGRLGHPA
jgi:hypothetical protein